MNSIKENSTTNSSKDWSSYWRGLVVSWLAEKCEHGAGAMGEKTLSIELLRSFNQWCLDRGISSLSARMFGDILRERGFIYAGKDSVGRVMRGHIRLKGQRLESVGEARPGACPGPARPDRVTFGG